MKAEAGMWLWTMRDFTVVAAAALISALVFAATKSPMPLAVTGVYGFLTIRFEDVCILDFLGWAIQYFITAQQRYRRELPGKKERKRKEKVPVKDLLHVKGFTDHGIDAGEGELVFFSVKPSNISVLSPESIWEKVWRLQTVLASAGELELLCLDSRESFADNQSHLRSLLRREENPKVRDVLEKDLAHLDSIQLEMATSRQFLFAVRIQRETPDQALAHINRVEKLIADQQFAVRRLRRDDLRKLLALYFYPTAEEEIPDGEDFFDRIMPEAIDFSVDHYLCGGRYCTAFALQNYPPRTKEQALLARLASQSGVTLHIYSRPVEMVEQRAMIQANTRKNRFQSSGNAVLESVTAEENLQDIAVLISNLRQNKEALLHTSVFVELRAGSREKLNELRDSVRIELEQAGIRINQLRLRQKEGFLAAMPLGSLEFDPRHTLPLPASSAANLFPLAYSGKTDPAGFYIGKDRFGTNILVDFDRRAADKTNANILILGNSGQGKSYLMKLLLINLRASGKTIIALDAEAEYRDLCTAMGGCYVDYASGEYIINPLEPKLWEQAEPAPGSRTEQGNEDGSQARATACLSQHIAYLKDFFRSYKGFSDAHIDVIELFLGRLYADLGITDDTDFSRLTADDYPVMEDFYRLVEREFQGYEPQEKHLYTGDILQDICLGLHSMCLGAESKFFNGHTNITDSRFLVFGVKELLHTNARLCGAVMFNLFSYLTGALLGKGNTVASLDELYLFLNNLTSIEYIRNAMKRVRKKDSAIVIATQNVDDFLMEGIREYTKPLFSIPAHQFLFNAGHAEPKAYTETLQMEPSEFERIRHAERGLCIYRAGGERFLLEVKAPDHKSVLFGKAGGK